jgi:putative transposase
MPRIARVIAVQYPHHITQRGNNRNAVFFEEEDNHFYIKSLQSYSRKWGFDIWAYCLMTNHVHILAVPSTKISLSKGIGSTNLVYTQYVNRKYARSGRLWQNRFFSTIVDSDQYLWSVVRYIESNPVRVGLISHHEEYPWSSCRAHVTGCGDELVTGKDWLDERDRKAYRDFLKTEDEETLQAIRKATSSGRPLGSEEFIKKIERKIFHPLLPKKAGRPKKKNE